jgi:RNA polymerase sigma factor (sigma-70 family)
MAERLLGPWAPEITRPAPDCLNGVIGVDKLRDAVNSLSEARWGEFADISAVTLGEEAEPIELQYRLIREAALVIMAVRVQRANPVVPSIADLLPAAEFYERQLCDALGIQFTPTQPMEYWDETSTRAASETYAEWVQSILDLNSDTWTELHGIYSSALRQDIQKSLRKRGLPLDVIDDIEQETWLIAIRRIRDEFTWVDEDRFYHWLRCIALNHVHTYRRKQSGYVSFSDFQEDDRTLDEFMDSYIWSGQSIEDEVIRHERLAALDRIIRTLPPRDGEILMRRLMGATPRELAKEYGMKPESLRMILWRAKTKIESELPPSMLEDKSDE